MKLNRNLLVFGMAGCLLLSCSNPTENETLSSAEEEEAQTAEVAEEVAPAETPTEDSDAIALIDGNKWAVNEEMKPFIEEGEMLVNAYVNNGDEDYLSLSGDLIDVNNELIKSCTMEGQSHEELHKWLHPHLELTKSLEGAENIDQANEIVAELVASYATFHEYFD